MSQHFLKPSKVYNPISRKALKSLFDSEIKAIRIKHDLPEAVNGVYLSKGFC